MILTYKDYHSIEMLVTALVQHSVTDSVKDCYRSPVTGTDIQCVGLYRDLYQVPVTGS